MKYRGLLSPFRGTSVAFIICLPMSWEVPNPVHPVIMLPTTSYGLSQIASKIRRLAFNYLNVALRLLLYKETFGNNWRTIWPALMWILRGLWYLILGFYIGTHERYWNRVVSSSLTFRAHNYYHRVLNWVVVIWPWIEFHPNSVERRQWAWRLGNASKHLHW